MKQQHRVESVRSRVEYQRKITQPGSIKLLHEHGNFKNNLPRPVKRLVNGTGQVSSAPTLKTLEEVVLLRKYDRKKQQSPREEFCEQLTDTKLQQWRKPNTMVRARSEVPTFIPQRKSTILNRRKSSNTKAKRHNAIQALRGQLENVLERLEYLETAKVQQEGTNQQHSNDSNDDNIDARYRCQQYAHMAEKDEDSLQENEEMILVMDGIQDTIERLENALSRSEQEQILKKEKHAKAATVIGAYCRGYLQRKRYRLAFVSLTRWKERNGSKVFRDRAIRFFKRDKIIRDRVADTCALKDQKLVQGFLLAWHAEMLSTRAERRRVAQGAALIQAGVNRTLLEDCFFHWYRTATGPSSRKKVEQKYKERYDRMRAKLVQENDQKPEASQKDRVTRAEVMEFMNKEAEKIIKDRRHWHMKRICFRSWSQDLMFSYNQLKKRADRHFLLRRFPRAFAAWKEYVEISQEDAKIAYKWSPEKFDAQHNERVIQSFARRTRLRKFLWAWKKLAKQCSRIRRQHKALQLAKMRAVFSAWRTRTSFQKQIKLLCIKEWKELSVRRRRTPFRAWYIYTKTCIRNREWQTVLLTAFERRKKRLLVARVFRTWSHKAIYGKTGGMLSRAELIKALETQKKMVLAMEVAATQQNSTIKELEQSLTNEKERSTQLQVTIAEQTEESIKQNFAKHQLEEEIVRLQSLFDSISLIHPGTAKRLLEIEEEKNPFQDRGVGAVARRTAQKKQMTGGLGATNVSGGGGLGGVDQGKPKPCSKCGFDEAESLVRPSSARVFVKEVDREKIAPKKQALTVDNVVWVSSRDADLLLRSQWAQKKLKQLARKSAKGETEKKEQEEVGTSEEDEILQEEEKELELLHLKAILAFIFSGDRTATHYFEPDVVVQESGDKSSAKPEPEVFNTLKKARLHTNASWNDFLQGLSKQFPLLHPANDDVKEGITRRIASAKHNIRQNKLRGNRRVNLYTSEN